LTLSPNIVECELSGCHQLPCDAMLAQRMLWMYVCLFDVFRLTQVGVLPKPLNSLSRKHPYDILWAAFMKRKILMKYEWIHPQRTPNTGEVG